MNNRPQLICAYRVYYPDQHINPFGYIHKLFFQGMAARDRFNIVTKYSGLNYVPKNDYDTLVGFNQSMTFETLIEKRVEYILNKAKAENKIIVVLWSGGIDSTFVLVNLLARKSSDQVLEIVYNDISLKDCNPDILQFIKRTGIKMHYSNHQVIIDLVETTYHPGEYICVTGVCSDQVCILGKLLDRRDLLPLPWEDAVERYIDEYMNSGPYFAQHKFSKDIIKAELEKLPVSVKTWAQFGMFWNNNVKSNKVPYDLAMLAQTDYYRENEIAFFNTTDYLNWGLVNLLPKLGNTHLDKDNTEYKAHLKESVVKITGIESFKYMLKTRSHWHDETNDYFRVLDTEGFKNLGIYNGFKKYDVLREMYPIPINR